MATPMFIRFSNFRNLLKINNNVLGVSSNTTQLLESIFRLSSTEQSTALTDSSDNETTYTTRAIKTYMKRIQQHGELIKRETFQYEKGKRHLANMMGMDPENFTQQDVDRSLEYLFPSGLYDPKARPFMKHPKEVFPSQKLAEFSLDGKPLHPFFYTIQPFYYEVLHNTTEQIKNLEDLEDEIIKRTGKLPEEDKIDLHGSEWISKVNLEKLLLEKLYDEQYEYFIKTMKRLIDHPLSRRAEEFIMKYRTKLKVDTMNQESFPVMHTEDGKPYVKVFPCKRKSAIATVTVFGEGTGQITINGDDITYFKDMQSRQQVSFCYFILLLLIQF
ncbi:hypothetical protein M0802_006896 [Mischocyttarus mexicanus]|nr:hypothetical protein M0802_006896 [Mischocyttarus mexicanus]